MGRNPCCSKEGLNRGAWTAVEDKILTEYIKVHGEGKWRNLPKRAGLKRCGKSCRLRWLNYLRPDIKRGNITHDEEELIIRLHNLLGNRWSLIAGRLPGRTDNEIKNYWNTNIGKKIQSGHPAATSNNNSTCRTKPSSSQHKLSPLSPNNKTTVHSGAPSIPSSNGVENSRVVRTKATRCTKVILLPHHDPQNVPPLLDHDPQHDNSSKSAVDTVPASAVNSELVNDSDDQMVAAGCVGLGDDQYEPFVPFEPDDHDQEICNTSPFMVGHHDFELDEKFLSDFLNIDGLDDQLELSSDCFANINESGHDLQVGEDFQNIRDKGSDEGLLFSDQDLLFGVELQSGAGSLIDPNEIDWLQD